MHISSSSPPYESSLQRTAAPELDAALLASPSSSSGLMPPVRPESSQAEQTTGTAARTRIKRPTDDDLRKWLALPGRQQIAHDELGALLHELADRLEQLDQDERYADASLHRKKIFFTLALIPVGFAIGMLLLAPFKPGRPDWHSNDVTLAAYAELARMCDQLGAAVNSLRQGFAMREEWATPLKGGSWASNDQVQALSQSRLASFGSSTVIMGPLAVFTCCLLALLLVRLCRGR